MTNASETTKGWSVERQGLGLFPKPGLFIFNPERVIAEVIIDGGRATEEDEANAKLIAAAPAAVEQLAALVKHVEALNHAFYVEGTAKALKVAFTGQRELLRSARELLASLEGAL